jgi:glutamate/tyrosine decarboxylase-like PLP-dependent enzyme
VTAPGAWGWDEPTLRAHGERALGLALGHLAGIRERPVFAPVPPETARRAREEPWPDAGRGPDELLDEVAEAVLPHPFGNGHPRFHGWVNPPPDRAGVLAALLAAAMNPSCAGGNHAAIYVERQVIDWFRQMLGFPAASMGLLVSGGSMATLTALVVARHVKGGIDVRQSGLRGAPRPFRFYQSPEGHSCVRKAVEALGFGSDSIRVIPTGGDYRMNVVALDRAIAEDVANGITPIAVTATAGTVNTGAIDPLDDIASVCAMHGVWLHVDAAYGGPAIVTDEYRGALAGLSRADSVALDPHKWMYVPVEAGFVLVRDGEAMRNAFSLVPPYIRGAGSAEGVMGLPWFSEYGLQQTRGFRALKVWMCVKHLGIAGYKAAIEENIALARYLADRVERCDDLELMAPPALSVVCFRYAGGDASRSAALNRAILERLQLSGEAFITSTELQGQFSLRACIVNHRSRREDVDRLIDTILRIARDLL